MKIHYWGHSAFAMEHQGKLVVIDPFVKNPLMAASGKQIPDLPVAAIVVTHGHDDHVGSAVEMAKKHNAPIVAVFELGDLLGRQGCQTVPCGTGGAVSMPWGQIHLVPAVHSSSYHGQYAGNAVGAIIEWDGFTLYHAGDTSVHSDMKLIGEIYKPQVACLPIGGHFTMDAGEALKAAHLLQVPHVIPMHYNTFPAVNADVQAFKQEVERTSLGTVKVDIMAAGDTLEL